MALFVQNSGNLVLKYVFIPWRHLDFATKKLYSCHSELENSNNVQVINDGAPRHIVCITIAKMAFAKVSCSTM